MPFREHADDQAPNKLTLFASATSSVRYHSLVTVLNVEEPEAMVLSTSTVGVVPGKADNVIAPAVVVAAGYLSKEASLILQYPL